MYPEGELREFETQKRIKEALLSFGIEESAIKVSGGSGFVVDLHGFKEGNLDAQTKIIALRADIDGLKMPEDNPDLPYRSKTQYAHMCGHDGHTATLVLAAWII